ncbi:lytic transglycosylase domain-containing protein [Ahrensia sp. R2A130]|uniref:lytic transglycosylase domain-containing protein n=1 Tax=Ahrensia sp. R2A130 TaxID=744979 RepID=UPI0001E08CA2|nr:lytic transglycosylase domain-containing protein [Ahrensia sp. R2A130]EFL88124.1 transglycosylase [Ahrensia sp. R2A130]
MLRNSIFVLTLLFVLPANAQTKAPELPKPADWPAERLCKLIDEAARRHSLPRATFTRLIWTESRFDVLAVSPVGAMGVAQFMPGTAIERGLKNPFAPDQAIEASAALLSSLRLRFGNFGLAAAAYNAGAGRVGKWLAGNGGLPFETRDYVVAITGKQAEQFRARDAKVNDFSLKKGVAFQQACAELPVLKTRSPGVPGQIAVPRQPWGVQVAGNFSRNRAMQNWERVRGKLGVDLGDTKPALYRERTRRGLKSKWAVRLGTSSRIGAIRLCKRIRDAGGFCLVKRNR